MAGSGAVGSCASAGLVNMGDVDPRSGCPLSFHLSGVRHFFQESGPSLPDPSIAATQCTGKQEVAVVLTDRQSSWAPTA